MKHNNKLILIGCLFVIFYSGCGTLGGWTDVCFSVPKKTFEVGVDSLFTNHAEYKIPPKWNDFNDWHKAGYDFLESWIFYFQSSPEEMYYVTIVDNPVNSVEPRTTIAIRAINMGSYRWFNYDDVSEKEHKRIQERFDTEIIPKLEAFTHVRAVKEDGY
jgi:hypothetical protein